jgi:hypothetical protein
MRHLIINLIPLLNIENDGELLSLLIEKLNEILDKKNDNHNRVNNLTLVDIGHAKGALKGSVIVSLLKTDQYYQKLLSFRKKLKTDTCDCDKCKLGFYTSYIDTDGELIEWKEPNKKSHVCKSCLSREQKISHLITKIEGDYRKKIDEFITPEMIEIKNVLNKISNKLNKLKNKYYYETR